MKHILILCLSLFAYIGNANGQRPKDGTYIYKVAFAEWQGRTLGATVLVKIKSDSIFVIHNGGNLSGQKGELIDSGIIMKHTATGKWIVGHHPRDRKAIEIGGCSDGPSVIDFSRKLFWLC
jgi:hypothetical protein